VTRFEIQLDAPVFLGVFEGDTEDDAMNVAMEEFESKLWQGTWSVTELDANDDPVSP
jgi:hypothetical protein